MIDRQLLEKAAAAIENSQELALACHVGPDGDALGSMIGFGMAAQAAGKRVVAGFGSPFSVPATLAFLPLDLLVDPGSYPERPETMVVFDAGSPDRLAELGSQAAELFAEASEKPGVSPLRKSSLKGMAASAHVKGGNNELSRKIWEIVYETSPSEERREFALGRIEEIDTMSLEQKLTESRGRR